MSLSVTMPDVGIGRQHTYTYTYMYRIIFKCGLLNIRLDNVLLNVGKYKSAPNDLCAGFAYRKLVL